MLLFILKCLGVSFFFFFSLDLFISEQVPPQSECQVVVLSVILLFL